MFFNYILFAIEIIVAELLFAKSLKMQNKFWLRILIWIGTTLVFAVICGFFPDIILKNAICSSLIFFCIFAVSLVMLYFCYKEPWINILFCGIAAYASQHFAFQISNMIFTIAQGVENQISGMYRVDQSMQFTVDLVSFFWILIYAFCFFVTYVLFYFIFAKRIKKAQKLEVKSTSLLLLTGAGLLVEIVLNSFVIYSSEIKTQYISVMFSLYSCLCCLFLLSMQFGLIKTKNLENELDFVKRLMAQQTENYLQNKENVELINMKCHDMRHQIREIGKNKFISQDAIDEIEKTIHLYDSAIKTGNEVLDTILTAKSLICAQNGIALSCVADGKLLSFMTDEELYSLYGNILDNAIEAVMKIDVPEKRIIGISLYSVNDFISFNVYNSYKAELQFEEGLPKTTKKDVDNHGYGIKSVKYIAEKYGGTVSVASDGGIFDLRILFHVPIKDN